MRKISVLFLLVLTAVVLFPSKIFASQDLIPPGSPLYFLQTLGENAKLYFTFSRNHKIEYLLTLTQKRVNEMAADPSTQIADRYAKHFQDLEALSSQVTDKTAVSVRIKDTSLKQQTVLAGVYVKVLDAGKGAILGAQTASSEHVANTVLAVEGEKAADDYNKAVQAIQKAEMSGQIEQVPMEGEPNANPSEENINAIKSGQGINPLNPTNDTGGGAGMQPAAPVPMR